MDNALNQLLEELKAVRVAVDSARTEAALNHREVRSLIADVRDRLAVIDQRLASLVDHRQTASGLPRLATANVVASLRAALLDAT